MPPKPVNLTPRRLQVLLDLAAGRTLVYRPRVLSRPASYRWDDNHRIEHYTTVAPLEDARLIKVHPVYFYLRVITDRGRAALESAGKP